MTAAKTTHVADGLARLVTQFRDQPRIRALLTAYLEQVQEVEDAFGQLLLYRWVDTAEGAQLDGLGEIVGEPRRGRTDTVYRMFLQARISVNASSGTPPNILAIAGFLLGGIDHELEEHAPAAWILRAGKIDADAGVVATILGQAKVGGVRAILEYLTHTSETTFAFAGAEGLGFGAGTFASAEEA